MQPHCADTHSSVLLLELQTNMSTQLNVAPLASDGLVAQSYRWRGKPDRSEANTRWDVYEGKPVYNVQNEKKNGQIRITSHLAACRLQGASSYWYWTQLRGHRGRRGVTNCILWTASANSVVATFSTSQLRWFGLIGPEKHQQLRAEKPQWTTTNITTLLIRWQSRHLKSHAPRTGSATPSH